MAKSKYAEAGVDFEKEHDVVDILKALYEKTLPFTEDLRELGISFPEGGSDFSGGFKVDIKKLLEHGIEEYVIQECVDGPGSKPVVHALYDGDDDIKHACTAIDSIAMNVNDLICSGARPLALTEYHSWNDTNVEIAKHMAVGNYIGAELSEATIIGGENASLSAMITGPVPKKAYDMCHMATGILLDKDLIESPLGKSRVEIGDVAIGLSSSGVHCNGVTLGWKTSINYSEKGYEEAHKINERVDDLGESVAEALLTPTIIYAQPIQNILEHYGKNIKAIANITGEGIHNMERVLPEGTGLNLDYSRENIRKPAPIFNWIKTKGDVPLKEMYEDYNMGTGMVIFSDADKASSIISHLDKIGRKQEGDHRFYAYGLGKVVKGNGIHLIAYDGTKLDY